MQSPRPTRHLFATAALLLPVLLAACGGGGSEQPAAEPTAAGPPAENAALGIALASVPAPFTVATNEGGTFTLTRSDGVPGEVALELGPEESAGVNLVAAVNDHKDTIESELGGSYNGQIELGSQLGTAYASRGRYPDGAGGETEDFRIFAIHPIAQRLLTIRYTYPAGDDVEERRNHLLALLGEVEASGSGAPSAPADMGSDAADDGAGNDETMADGTGDGES